MVTKAAIMTDLILKLNGVYPHAKFYRSWLKGLWESTSLKCFPWGTTGWSLQRQYFFFMHDKNNKTSHTPTKRQEQQQQQQQIRHKHVTCIYMETNKHNSVYVWTSEGILNSRMFIRTKKVMLSVSLFTITAYLYQA